MKKKIISVLAIALALGILVTPIYAAQATGSWRSSGANGHSQVGTTNNSAGSRDFVLSISATRQDNIICSHALASVPANSRVSMGCGGTRNQQRLGMVWTGNAVRHTPWFN